MKNGLNINGVMGNMTNWCGPSKVGHMNGVPIFMGNVAPAALNNDLKSYGSMSCIEMIHHYGDLYLHSDLFLTSLNDLSESDYDLGEPVNVHCLGYLDKPAEKSIVYTMLFYKLLHCHNVGVIKINLSDNPYQCLMSGANDDLYLSSFKRVERSFSVEMCNGSISKFDHIPFGVQAEVIDFIDHLESLYSPHRVGVPSYVYEISICDGELYVSSLIFYLGF